VGTGQRQGGRRSLSKERALTLNPKLWAQGSVKGEGVHGQRSEEDVIDVLSTMGFDEAKRANAVLELSGGWRMKLALAGAILREADLLLLDEPTNHLDAASVQWLAEYLKTLDKTTVVMVSRV
jgi:ATPase subunit of ABC transporter with duplicated ATPase domains